MVYFTRHLSDAYLREIADHYARLEPAYPPPASGVDRAVLARGEALVREGDRAKDIPACAACHGKSLTGMLPATPGLVGLVPDYVNGQLGAWRSGLRRADAPDCMARIAQRLSAADGAAVAAYLASLPGSHAAPEAATRLPMECGTATRMPPAPIASAAPSRGEFLARAGDCIACHTARGGAPFAGGLELQTPFGRMVTPNITPDSATGIGAWTADDFFRAMHEGRSKDGTLLYPAFPYPSYTKVSREDSDAIFAYLRTFPPVAQKNRPHALEFPYNQRALLLAWRALYFKPGAFVPDPSRSPEWNRGAYLVQGLGHCDACHSPRNLLGATAQDAGLAGGLIARQDWYAPSLTSSREAGLGQWDVGEIADLLRTGVSARGAVFGPMSQVVHDSLQYLSEGDARAMAVYLKSLADAGTSKARAAEPAASSRMTESQLRASYDNGGALYDRHCKSCHGANGRGVPPAIPPLAGNQAIAMESPVNPVRIVLFGGFPPSTAGNPRPFGMPPFAYTLGDQDVADVVTYMRRAWGNRAAPVTAAEVAKYRSVPVD
ncbi:MAG: c-type cytochrome [Burkholderiales bacterium]